VTSTTRQGSEAIEQQVVLGIMGPGRTLNPWLQGQATLVGAVFSDLSRARSEVEPRVRQAFAQLEAQEYARLVGQSVYQDGDGKVVCEVRWLNLRLSGDDQQRLTNVPVGT